MAKKNGRRNNKLKKAASTAARASDTGTGPKNAIEQCWYPIFNDREHLLLTDLFKEESLQGDCSACVPMLFNHGSKDETSRTDSNNEFSGETKVIPTWVVINYDHGEDEFYAKALDPDRYVCSSEINHRQLFTLEEVHFSDQQLWLWFWLKEEDLWEQDELLWEEEFGLDGADMRLRKQECLRLLQNGQVNSAWELGKVMARDLLHAAGEDHEDDNEKYWVVDETTGKRTLPAEANIPNMTERFGTQRRFYAICDYRNRGVPKLENENDVPAADDGDGDENGEDEELESKDSVDRICSQANGSNHQVQQESSRDGSEIHTERDTDSDDDAAVVHVSPPPPSDPDLEHESPEHARRPPPQSHFTHTPNNRLRDMTPFIIQFPLPDGLAKANSGEQPSNPAAEPTSKSKKKKKKKKSKPAMTPEAEAAGESNQIPDSHIITDSSLSHNNGAVVVPPEPAPVATMAPKKKKKKKKKAAKKKATPPTQPPSPSSDHITSFSTVATEPLLTTTAPTTPLVAMHTSSPTDTAPDTATDPSSPCSPPPRLGESASASDANWNRLSTQLRLSDLEGLLTSGSPYDWTSVATLGFRETWNMAMTVRERFGMGTVRRGVVLFAVKGERNGG